MDYQIEMMREEVKDAYPGRSWSNKVDKMPDKQVMAIYYRLLRESRKSKKG